MATWKTRTCIETCPKRVLELLTDPDACERWSPVAFDIDGLDGTRLTAGTRARLAGRIAGLTVAFDVQIDEADERRLELTASGPSRSRPATRPYRTARAPSCAPPCRSVAAEGSPGG
jgi:uncharacterized protein YndB with AHSA1/START domain